jgi:inner membrane protein
MDPIAHTLVGAALAQTGLGRRTAYATPALIIGANLPDVDVLTMLAGGDAALFARRGWTHGIPAAVVLPLVLAAIFFLWSRVAKHRPDRAAPPLSFGVLLGLSYLAVATHPSLDWLNTYGVRWLMPFQGRWFYGDSVFIIDPWMWLVLGGAVFLFHSRRAWSIVGWGIFAATAGLVLVRALPGLEAAKILWLAGVGLLILLRVRRIGVEEIAARRLAVGALAATTVYIGLMVASARYARRAVADTLAARGVQVEKLMVGPVPVTPFVRDVVAQTPDGYRHGKARLFPRFGLELAPKTLPPLAESPVVRVATASRRARGFMSWVRFPFSEVEASPSGFTVYLLDARYTRARTRGFGARRVEVSKEQLDAHEND